MRELKYDEKKLLKKVDFFDWKLDDNDREIKIMRRYYVQKREDLKYYSKLVGKLRRIIYKLKALDKDDLFRIRQTKLLMNKLYDMGILNYKTNLEDVEKKVNVSAFCRRRLPVVLFRNKYCETMKEAVTFVEQSQIRVGVDVINNPAFIVTRSMEDHITWTEGSKIKKKLEEYNGTKDDYNE